MRESHIGVELAYEAAKVAVLEVPTEQVALEGVRVRYHEAAAGLGPRDHLVGRRVGDHVVHLGQKRRHIWRLRHRPHRRRSIPGRGTDIAGCLVQAGGAGGGGGTGRRRRRFLRAHRCAGRWKP